MRPLFFYLSILCLLTFACENKEQRPSSINGIWKSIGSGWILHIEDSTHYALYDITSISCLPGRASDLQEILPALELNRDTLSLLKGVVRYQFTRGEALPDHCREDLGREQQDNPLYNFDVFAETVKEHYAFFQLNDLNWDQLYHQQRGKLSERSSEEDLYKVLEETLEILKDNHAYLEATEEFYEALEEDEEDNQELVQKEESLPEYGDFQIAAMVAKHHLEEEMTKDSWLIQWGKFTDNIGFVQVKSMWLYADLDIPPSMIEDVGFVDAYVETFHKMEEGEYIEKEVKGVQKIMDQVMHDLSDMDALVFDIRFNGGGQDAVSFEILSRCVSGIQLVAKQKLRHKNQFSPEQSLYIEGVQDPFSKPVYVLTSPQTGSAAEAFAIATMSLNHVTRIGSHTSGAMSTALEKTLPNGWVFAISNEIYMDTQGENYENIGIPVDVELGYPEDRQTFFRAIADGLLEDKQNILTAITNLRDE
ncbi:MAG: S41 family peptidase [Bacteroidota bacterium]